MIAQKFIIAEKNRQIVLDLLNEHGPMTHTEIRVALGMCKGSNINYRLEMMAHLCEVKRIPGTIATWQALVTTTMTAEQADMNNRSPRRNETVIKGNRIVHRMADTPKKSYPAQTSKSRPRGCTILEAGL
ncbi:MAG: hypothetical protein ACYCZJ_13330 [Sulfuriferula sp.]